MIEPVWCSGAWEDVSGNGQVPVVWHVQLDDPAIERLARQAPLRGGDWRDLAPRPQSAMRAMRRQLAKLLLARLSGCHPDDIAFGRTAAGALTVLDPAGWHVCVAGRWPHALIGASRAPIGVDIEPGDAEPPPRDALTPGERCDLAAATDQERLIRWVAKEAHAKLLGQAAQADPADIHTQVDGGVIQVVSPAGRTVCQISIAMGAVRAVASQPADGHPRQPSNASPSPSASGPSDGSNARQ